MAALFSGVAFHSWAISPLKVARACEVKFIPFTIAQVRCLSIR